MLGITLDQLERYLFVETRHDRSQWGNYRCRFNKLLLFFRDIDFNPEGISDFILSIEGKSSSTIHKYFDTLEYICRILKVNHMERFKRPRVVYRKKFVLSSPEMRRVLDYAYKVNYRNALIMEIAMRQGLRFNEIRQLKWTDIIDNEITLRDTKAGVPQTVYFPNDLIEKIKKIKNGKVYVFEFYNGLLSNQWVNVFLRRCLIAVGIRKPMSFHDLRHTAASELANNDINMKVIQDFMRHSTITTTEKYVHVSGEKLLEAAKKHSLAAKNWTKEDLIKEITKFEKTILNTNFKPSIEYREKEVEIKISY